MIYQYCYYLYISVYVCSESVFNVQYSLNIDSVQVSATVQSSVSIEAIATNLATVTNAQGIAYEVRVVIVDSIHYFSY